MLTKDKDKKYTVAVTDILTKTDSPHLTQKIVSQEKFAEKRSARAGRCNVKKIVLDMEPSGR